MLFVHDRIFDGLLLRFTPICSCKTFCDMCKPVLIRTGTYMYMEMHANVYIFNIFEWEKFIIIQPYIDIIEAFTRAATCRGVCKRGLWCNFCFYFAECEPYLTEFNDQVVRKSQIIFLNLQRAFPRNGFYTPKNVRDRFARDRF